MINCSQVVPLSAESHNVWLVCIFATKPLFIVLSNDNLADVFPVKSIVGEINQSSLSVDAPLNKPDITAPNELDHVQTGVPFTLFVVKLPNPASNAS